MEEFAIAALACRGLAACPGAGLGAWHPQDGPGLHTSGVRPAPRVVGRSLGLGGEAGGSWRGFQVLPSPGCIAAAARSHRALMSPPLSSVNVGIALKNEEYFAGAAFRGGSRACREPRVRRAHGDRAVQPRGGWWEQAGSLGWAHRGRAGMPNAEGLIAAGLACLMQRGSLGPGWRAQCRGAHWGQAGMPSAEGELHHAAGRACAHTWRGVMVRCDRAGAVMVRHVRQAQGCWLPQRLLVAGEAAVGSVSPLAGCCHRSDGFKVPVLIWQRQL